MANEKISQLTNGNPAVVGDTIPIERSVAGTPTNFSVTAESVAAISGFTSPLPVAKGGTGTATPALVAGTNVVITGSFPNQTINAVGGGGGASFSTAGQGFFWSNGQMNTPFLNSTASLNTQNIIAVTANEVFVVQFTLLASYTIRTVSFICGANGTVHVGVGIYDASGNKLLDTGAISTAGVSNNIISKTLGSPVTLSPGVYYFAATCDDNGAVFDATLIQQGSGTGTSIGALFIPSWASSFPNPQQGGGSIPLYSGTAANHSVAGALPATLGTISAVAGNSHYMLWALFSV